MVWVEGVFNPYDKDSPISSTTISLLHARVQVEESGPSHVDPTNDALLLAFNSTVCLCAYGGSM